MNKELNQKLSTLGGDRDKLQERLQEAEGQIDELKEQVLVSVITYWPTVMETYPVVIYLFRVNNRNTRTRCEICSNLTIKTPE